MKRPANQPATGAALVEQLFKAAFDRPRNPRSAEYKAGARAVLDYRVNGTRIPARYPMGTVQADAYLAGVDEGHAIWRAHQAEQSDGAAHAESSSERAANKDDVLNAIRWAAEDALEHTAAADRRAAMFAAHLSGGLGSSLIREVALSDLIYSLVSDKPAAPAGGV